MSARRVPVNAASLLIGRVAAALATVAIVALAAHRLDAGEFGLLTSVMAAGFLANTFVTFGTDTVVTRAVAAERADAAASAKASIALQLSVAAVLVVAAVIATVAGADIAIMLQALALVPLAAVTVVSAILRGRQRMDQLLVATMGGAAVALVSVVIGLPRYPAPWLPVAAIGIGATTTAALGWRFVRHGTHDNEKRSLEADTHRGAVRSMVRETAPFAAMVFLAAVGAQGGLLLVEFASDEATGGYGVAIRLTEAARLVPAAAMGAFFPAMLSGAHRTAQYRRWMQGLIIYAIAATVLLIVFADIVNRLVFDAQPGGTTLIRIISLGVTLTVLRLAWSFELIAAGRETRVLISALAGAAVTLVGGLAVAGPAGANGVAWMQLGGLAVATALLAFDRSSQRGFAATPVRMGELDRGNR